MKSSGVIDMAKVVAVAEEESGPKGPYLGHLCWFTVPDAVRFTRTQLEDAFLAVGLARNLLPPPIRLVDAYRRATGRIERTYPGPQKNTKVNLLVREVACTRERVVRLLVAETVDANNVRLSYETVAKLSYDRALEGLEAEVYVLDDRVDEAVAAAKESFHELCSTYEGEHIRRMIMGILAGMRPTIVRPSGGVYFVPHAYASQLERLVEVVAELSKRGGECRMWSVPLVDTARVRSMVRESFVEQVSETVGAFRELLQASERPRDAEIVAAVTRAKALIEDIREYEKFLETTLLELAADVEIVQGQMLALLEKN